MNIRILLGILWITVPGVSFSQQINWQNADLEKDKIFGISLEKAYSTLLKGKKSKPVIVAVIDSGIDTSHADLRPVLWSNTKEIPGNGIDDDHNGYIDDIHGWNFTGLPVSRDSLRQLIEFKKAFYDSLSYTSVPPEYQESYQKFRKIWAQYSQLKLKLESSLRNVQDSAEILPRMSMADLIEPNNNVSCNLIFTLSGNDDIFHFQPLAFHGTHIAGIIAAERNNNTGIDGIADHVQIMPVKIYSTFYPNFNDGQLASAIRYAVDNGARIINLSLGDFTSDSKKEVDKAVRYAMSHDVLIVHAAGNNGKDLDDENNATLYPNKYYSDGTGMADAWINVGASASRNDSALITGFSNYGKVQVDVFAPGQQIYSTIPGNRYMKFDGTSMAAPIVCGIAALIREYYPKLSAIQVKEIIMKSVVKRDVLKDKCVSGGVVNAYNALRLASTYK